MIFPKCFSMNIYKPLEMVYKYSEEIKRIDNIQASGKYCELISNLCDQY